MHAGQALCQQLYPRTLVFSASYPSIPLSVIRFPHLYPFSCVPHICQGTGELAAKLSLGHIVPTKYLLVPIQHWLLICVSVLTSRRSGPDIQGSHIFLWSPLLTSYSLPSVLGSVFRHATSLGHRSVCLHFLNAQPSSFPRCPPCPLRFSADPTCSSWIAGSSEHVLCFSKCDARNQSQGLGHDGQTVPLSTAPAALTLINQLAEKLWNLPHT